MRPTALGRPLQMILVDNKSGNVESANAASYLVIKEQVAARYAFQNLSKRRASTLIYIPHFDESGATTPHGRAYAASYGQQHSKALDALGLVALAAAGGVFWAMKYPHKPPDGCVARAQGLCGRGAGGHRQRDGRRARRAGAGYLRDHVGAPIA